MFHFTCSSFRNWATDWQSTSILMLGSEELARLKRFHSSKRKMQFLAGRLLARTLIAEQVGCSPHELVFDAERPTIAYCDGIPLLNLSISHTSDFVTAAVGKAPVGIDYETNQPLRDWLAIAQNYFSRYEVSWLRDQPAHLLTEEFIRIWTAKEALAKCCGEELGKLLAIPTPVGELATWPEPYGKYRCWGGSPQQDTYVCLVGEPSTKFSPIELSGTCRVDFNGAVSREVQLRPFHAESNLP